MPAARRLLSCGGLSQGLKQAGFAVVAAVEADPLAMSTFAMNHPRTHRHLGDITKLSATHLMRDLGMKPGELDLLAGCPPCQGFSTLRTLNGSNKIVDPMNDLVGVCVCGCAMPRRLHACSSVFRLQKLCALSIDCGVK